MPNGLVFRCLSKPDFYHLKTGHCGHKSINDRTKMANFKTQWGSEIRTGLDLEWSKRGWVANGMDFEWDLKYGSQTI